MAQLTKQDIKDVMEEMGVVTETSLKKMGVVTESSIKKMGLVTEKTLKRELGKVKRELQASIANVALSSPTSNQFYKLEKRVDQLEVAIN